MNGGVQLLVPKEARGLLELACDEGNGQWLMKLTNVDEEELSSILIQTYQQLSKQARPLMGELFGVLPSLSSEWMETSFAVIGLLGMEHERNSNGANKRARCAGAAADLQVLRTRGKSTYTRSRMYPARPYSGQRAKDDCLNLSQLFSESKANQGHTFCRFFCKKMRHTYDGTLYTACGYHGLADLV